MANLDKNIIITPNVGANGDPTIVFSAANTTSNAANITLRAYPTSNGTLSFEGSAGQLFSITNNLTGTLFSVNDISGIPSIEVLSTGRINLAQYNGNVVIGANTSATPAYSNTTGELVVFGGLGVTGNIYSGSQFITGTGNGVVFVDGTIQTTAGSSVANTIYLQGVDTAQNTRMTVIEGVDVSQNNRMTINDGVNASQNVRLDFSNTRMTIIEGVDVGQNTLIQTVFNTANTGYNFVTQGGTVTGNVSIFGNLDVSGNISVIGNVTNVVISGNSGQFFGNNTTGFEALYAGIAVGYDFQPQTILQTSGNFDGYTQFNIQNINPGTDASADIVATADNGSENDTFIDMGIGSSNYSDPTDFELHGPNDGYLYVHGNTATGGGNLVFSTKHQNDIIFSANGLNSADEVARFKYDEGLILNRFPLTFDDGTKQNTAASPVNYTQASFNTANTGLILSQAAYNQANVTIGVDVTQNTRLTVIEGTDTSQNVRMAVIEGVNASQNVRLDYSNTALTIVQGVDVSQNARMAIIEGVDTSQNARMTIIENTDLSQNVRLDFSNTRMTISDGVNASQNVRLDYSNTAITIIQGVDIAQNTRLTVVESTDLSQNVRLDYSNTRMAIIEGTDASQNVRLDYSNTAITIVQGVDTSQNARMTIIEGVDVSQNARMTISDGVNASQNVRLDYSNAAITIIQGIDVSQNSRITIIEGVNVTQNTNITAANTPAGLTTQIQFNDGGIRGADASLTFDKTTATLTAGIVASSNNGNGTNFKVGDDAWIGDINLADTISIKGQQNSANAYIGFGNNDGVRLGRAGSGPLAYGGAFTANGEISSLQSSGDEGGQFNLALAATNQSLSGSVAIDIYQNKFRIYETGGSNRGAYIDLTAASGSVGTNLLTSSGAAIDQWVRDTANVTIGVDASQNVRLDYSNTALTIAQGVDNSQNVRLDYSNSAITIIQGVDTSQNSRMTIIEGTDASQNVRLDYSNSAITIIQGVDVSQNARMTISDGVNASQNVRLDYSNTALTIAQGVDASQNVRLDYSNTAITIIQGVDVGQNSRMTIIEGVDVGQNSRMTIIEGTDVSQNVRLDYSNAAITIIQGVDVTQNTNIANKLSLSGASLQTVTGNVVFGNDVTVTGNLVVLGNTISLNVTSFEVDDTLIQLGIGNYTTDALSIGYVGHYNDGTNAHAGFIRDALTKEFYAFQGYTPEVSGNVININAASFAKANIHGNWFKGNLIATTARVGDLDIKDFSTAAFNQANTADVRSTASYFHANGAFIKANAAFDQANVTIGVDTSQNARMTIIEGTNASQNVRLDYSNTAITIIQGIDVGQNTRLTVIEGTDTSQNARMTIIEGVDTTQNTRITVIENTDLSQNVRLNFSNTRMDISDGVDASQNVSISTQNSFITIIQGVDVGQNSRMTIIEGTDTSQNARITIIEGVDVGQNTRLTVIEGTDASQNVRLNFSNTRMDISDGVNTSQNVRLDFSNTAINATDGKMQSAYNQANTGTVLAQAAFNQANTGGGGGTAFSRIIVSGSPDAIANIANAPLTFVAGSGMTITTVGTSNTITFASTGGFDGGTITGQLIIANSNTAISNTTGALQVQGGVGITGNLYIGTTSINTNRTITNYGVTVNSLGSGSGSRTIDLTLGNFVTATVSGVTTWTFSNPVSSPNACGFILELTNGGSATQNWPPAVRWPGGTAPTLTASGVDILVFITDDGGTNWRGVASMVDSK